MAISRRVFLGQTAAVVGTAALPNFLIRAARAADRPGGRPKRLVVLFLRGAADGLNILVPHGEPGYYAARPSIQIPRGAVIDLDGFFGMHPAMASLQPAWKQRHLAFVGACGSPDGTRSHFDAQDFMETGTPGEKATVEGWLNRALRGAPGQRKALRALALGPSLPRSLLGAEPAAALDGIGEFGDHGTAPRLDAIEAMYEHSTDGALQAVGRETVEAVKALNAADLSRYAPARGVKYPGGRFGESLKQLAQLIKADLGVQAAFADIGGWDHHVNEGNTVGHLAILLREFSDSLSAFWLDLGDLGEDTVIVAMSEFGRTLRENGSRGTDHGHANVMFVLGGPVQGGRVYGKWPGLDREQLYEGRDLAVTTDFRRVLGEAVRRHMGNTALDTVFPGFDNNPSQFLGYLGPADR
jgi:uncharacterized protein (DUF1501 family)